MKPVRNVVIIIGVLMFIIALFSYLEYENKYIRNEAVLKCQEEEWAFEKYSFGKLTCRRLSFLEDVDYIYKDFCLKGEEWVECQS